MSQSAFALCQKICRKIWPEGARGLCAPPHAEPCQLSQLLDGSESTRRASSVPKPIPDELNRWIRDQTHTSFLHPAQQQAIPPWPVPGMQVSHLSLSWAALPPDQVETEAAGDGLGARILSAHAAEEGVPEPLPPPGSKREAKCVNDHCHNLGSSIAHKGSNKKHQPPRGYTTRRGEKTTFSPTMTNATICFCNCPRRRRELPAQASLSSRTVTAPVHQFTCSVVCCL